MDQVELSVSGTIYIYRPAVHSDFIGIISIFSRKMALIPIFRIFFADSDFLMALIPIFENLRSVVMAKKKTGKLEGTFTSPAKKKEKENPES